MYFEDKNITFLGDLQSKFRKYYSSTALCFYHNLIDFLRKLANGYVKNKNPPQGRKPGADNEFGIYVFLKCYSSGSLRITIVKITIPKSAKGYVAP